MATHSPILTATPGGRWRWLASIVAAGLRPELHNDRRLREHLGATPADTLARFEGIIEADIESPAPRGHS